MVYSLFRSTCIAFLWGPAICTGPFDILARFDRNASELAAFMGDDDSMMYPNMLALDIPNESRIPRASRPDDVNHIIPDAEIFLLQGRAGAAAIPPVPDFIAASPSISDNGSDDDDESEGEEGSGSPESRGDDVSTSTMQADIRDPAGVMAPSAAASAAATKRKHGQDRGLSTAERVVCLNELIGDPEMVPSLFTQRVIHAIPAARPGAALRYRRMLLEQGRAPIWLHNLLLTQASVPELNLAEVVTAAAIKAASIGPRVPIPTASMVADWLEFAISPLLAHRGRREDIVSVNPKTDRVQLSSQQFKAFLLRKRADAVRILARKGRPVPARTTVAPSERSPISAIGSSRRSKRRRMASDLVDSPATPRKVSSLTAGIKRTCLEDLIAHPEDTPAAFLRRVLNLFPAAPETAMRAYRNNLLARGRLPKLLHAKLLAHVLAGNDDMQSIVAECRPLLTRGATVLHESLSHTLWSWRELCIWPLLAHKGSTGDIVQAAANARGSKVENVRLSNQQMRVFLRRELDKLPPETTAEPELPDRISDITTTIAPPELDEEDLTESAGASGLFPEPIRYRTRGLDVAPKQAIVRSLIEHPGSKLSQAVDRASTIRPRIDPIPLRNFCSSVLSYTRVPRELHLYLLRLRAVEWVPSMAGDIGHLFGQRSGMVRRQPAAVVNIWGQYCIGPLLAAQPGDEPPCVPERERTGLEIMRLSLSQRRAYFIGELAKLDKEAAGTVA